MVDSKENWSIDQAKSSAHAIVAMCEDERVKLFHSLRRSKKLTATVRELNRLASEPSERDLANNALRGLGLGSVG